MNFLSRMVFGSKSEEQKKDDDHDADSKSQEDGEVLDVLGKYMPTEMLEEMFCYNMSDC